MNKPRIAQVFDRDAYWTAIRMDNRQLPEWAFDFISVHGPAEWRGNTYSLVSPTCVNETIGGVRPEWCEVQHRTKADAIREARRLCKEDTKHHLFVVIVPNFGTQSKKVVSITADERTSVSDK